MMVQVPLKTLLISLCLLALVPNTSLGQLTGGLLSKEKFNAPDNISKPLTWWHWINGNVTKTGIKKDLEDMRRVGIAGVQLFDTHMYLPKGPVRYGSDSWHEHVQYAIKTCDSLGMEFYIANSPGWSGAGGPWITEAKSMKQIVYSETDVDNPGADLQLRQAYSKQGFYKDIAVLAVAAKSDGQVDIRAKLEKISSDQDGISLSSVFDENYATGFRKHSGKEMLSFLEFEFKEPMVLNSLTIDLSIHGKGLSLEGSIEVSEDGRNFKEVEKFNYADHIAWSGNFTIPFSSVSCKFLRVRFAGTGLRGKDLTINELVFRNLIHTKDWYKRTSMSNAPYVRPKQLRDDSISGLSDREVIDLTKYFDAATGRLKTSYLPKGKWTVLRFGYTTTAKKIHPAVDEGTGYEVDKLDPDAVTFQFNQSLGRIISDAGALTGKTFKGLLFDSFEGGFQNWTEKMPAMFLKHTGYDIRPFLPVLAGRTVHSGVVSSGFLWDFQQTLTDLFSVNYYQTMQSLAHQHQLQLFSETQGGPMSPAYGNKYVDIPMNEFWTDGIEKREVLIKQTVSIANVLGKNIVAAESFTSKPEFGKWQNLPENLKKIGDYAFTTGINKFIFHTYTHQPYDDVLPGFTMGRYGTHFGRTNTWWKYAPEWGRYLGRSQYLLQQGRMVSDICYLYPKDVLYQFPPGILKIPQGFNYDIIYPQYLSNIKVTNGQMTLPSGAKYRLMILPDYPYMLLETLQQLEALLKQGVILVGPPPIAAPGILGAMQDGEKFAQLLEQLWGTLDGHTNTTKSYGSGKIYWGKPIDQVLEENKIAPDVFFEAKNADSIRYIHRSGDHFDVYFISNQLERPFSSNLSFRVKDKQPQVWDAATGKISDIIVNDTINHRTSVPLQLDPNGSIFVVFEKPIVKNNLTLGSKSNQPGKQVVVSEMTIDSPWSLRFLDGRGAPESITTSTLSLWNKDVNPNIKYYSGTVEYNNTFTLNNVIEKNERLILNFEELYDLAEVIVNGKSAGVIWKKPHQLEITSLLKKGKNDLKILVVNRWINRLIGDEFIPSDLKYDNTGSIFSIGKLLELPAWLKDKSVSRTDKRNTFTTWKHYNTGSALVDSGLSGAVKLTVVNEVDTDRR